MMNSNTQFITNYDKIKCAKSNIKEAWTLVQGLPYVIDDNEVKESNGALGLAKKQFENLKVDPIVFAMSKTNNTTLPFWTNQFSWEQKTKLTRVGPRFLAFHRIIDPKVETQKYTSFDKEILPNVNSWLKIYKDSFEKAQDHQVQSVSFGYINRFSFNMADGFDISKYFKFQLGIGANFDPTSHQLNTFSSSVKFLDKDLTDGHSSLFLDLRGEIRPDQTIQIDTHARAKVMLNNNIKFTDIDSVQDYIRKSQKRAKKTFFQFITRETFENEMGGSCGE